MKKLSLLFLAFLPLFAAATPAKPKAPKERLLALRVEKNSSATITLRENITTGFRWLAKYDPALCKVEIAHRGPENTGGEPVCGAPGKAVITVTLLTNAPAELTLEYRRPWEKDTPPAVVLHYAILRATNTVLLPPKR